MTITAVRPDPAPHVAPKRRRGRPWIPLLFVLAGVIVLLYPVVATEFNNVKQHQFAAKYDKQVAQAEPQDLKTDLERARDYNSKLEGIPILDPWLARVSGDPRSKPYRAYLRELALFDAMARVRVPSAGIDLPVYHGTTDDVLGRGAGHLYGTSLPVGGTSTHAVLTSHRGIATATLFDHLPDVKLGEKMYIDVYGETLAYQVDQIKTVLPNQIDDLKKVDGQDYLTLMTCTPYAINSHRLLVRGHRVAYDPAASGAKPDNSTGIRLERWMYWMIAGALVGLLAMVLITVHEVRLRRRLSQPRAPSADSPPDDADLP